MGSQGSSGHVRSLHGAGCLPRQTKVLPRGPVRPQRGGAGWRGVTLASPRGGAQLPPRSTPHAGQTAILSQRSSRKGLLSPVRKRASAPYVYCDRGSVHALLQEGGSAWGMDAAGAVAALGGASGSRAPTAGGPSLLPATSTKAPGAGDPNTPPTLPRLLCSAQPSPTSAGDSSFLPAP